MRIQKIKIVLAGFAAAVLLTSCTDMFDKGENGRLPIKAWGDILRHEGKENFDIVMDNNDTIRTINTSHIDKEDTKTGTRVVFTATVHDETPANPNILCTATLNDIVKIKVEKPILSSWVNEEQNRIDSVGNDPIEVYTLSVSGKYLNLDFSIRQNDGSIKHTISYVVDDENGSSNNVLNIYLRHNGNGDIPASPYRNLMSCDIKEYMDAVQGEYLTINLYYNNGGVNDIKKTVTWSKSQK